MTDGGDFRELKRRLSPRLLEIRGVSGVGARGGTLIVYLEKDSDEVRQKVAAVLKSEAPGTRVTFVVTGAFRRQ